MAGMTHLIICEGVVGFNSVMGGSPTGRRVYSTLLARCGRALLLLCRVPVESLRL